MTAPVLSSDRIILRPYRLADFDRLAEIYQSPRAAYIGGLRSLDKVWRDFASDVGQWELMGFGCWSIEDRASGACVGQTGLNFPAEYPEREIGWVLWEEFEGKGYAFEAAKLARAFAFETLKFDTLVSYIDPENARSIKLAEKLGAVLDKGAATPNGEACLVYRHMP
jgi:RimJ/RimL family protein N-acetyltransferase